MKKRTEKKIAKTNEAENSEQSQNEKSEEFLNFEQGLRAIFSLSPEEAKKIRDEYPENPTDEQIKNS